MIRNIKYIRYPYNLVYHHLVLYHEYDEYKYIEFNSITGITSGLLSEYDKQYISLFQEYKDPSLKYDESVYNNILRIIKNKNSYGIYNIITNNCEKLLYKLNDSDFIGYQAAYFLGGTALLSFLKLSQ